MAPPVAALAQIAQGVGVLASAWAVKQLIDDHTAMGAGGGSAIPKCPRCNGSRSESCFCNRWSDNDVGCKTCRGSGRMPCSSCGGSGRGRPIPAQIHATKLPAPPKGSRYNLHHHSDKFQTPVSENSTLLLLNFSPNI